MGRRAGEEWPRNRPTRVGALFIIVLAASVLVVSCGQDKQSSDPETTPASSTLPEIADLAAIDPAVAAAIRRAVAEVESSPNEAESYGRLGRLYQAHEYYELARQCYESAHRLDPAIADWPYYLGVFAAERGQDEKAVRYFREMARLRPEYAPLHLRLGDALLGLGDLEAAEVAYRQHLSHAPASAWGYLGLGKVARRRSRESSAVEVLERALELDPRNHEAIYVLAMTYRELDRREAALSLLDRLADGGTSPQPPDSLMEKVLRERKDLQSIIRVANKALADGEPDRAAALYRLILDQDPDHFDALHNLGIVYGRQGRYAEAAAALRSAVQQRPESREAHHGLAMAYASQEKLERAIAELQTVLEIDPDYEPSRQMRANLEEYMATASPP